MDAMVDTFRQLNWPCSLHISCQPTPLREIPYSTDIPANSKTLSIDHGIEVVYAAAWSNFTSPPGHKHVTTLLL